MAFDNPPFCIDATTVDGEVIRRAIGSLINPAGGIVTAGDLQVTQNGTPNMTVLIGIGQIWVPGSTTSTQGPYYSRNGGSISQAINAADATNPRIDTVGVQVQDAAYAGALKQLAPFYVAGTATAGANLTNLTGKGAVPASSYVLAYVLVPGGATSIVTADILNVATPVGLGIGSRVRVLSASATASPGDSILASPGVTVTLPSATASAAAPITITAGASVTGATPVTVSGSSISGLGLSGAASFPLGAPGASATLVPENGAWTIVSGQQDTGWVTPSVGAPWAIDSNQPFAWRCKGDRVDLEGQINNISGTTQAATTVVFNFPAPYRAAHTYAYTIANSSIVVPIILTNGNFEPQIALGAGGLINCNGLWFSTT